MTFKKITGTLHLWLGLASGLIVCFLGITGCILAFQQEIERAVQEYRFVEPQDRSYLPPSRLGAIASAQLPGKHRHSITYGDAGDAAVVAFYNIDPEYYFLAFLNPYTGEVLKVKDMSDDFFRIMINGHFYLWLPPAIGQPVVASATLCFFVLLVTGLILWWPKNKSARKQRFTVKWTARWRRVNYDMHNVLGFYAMFIAFFLATTGLIMGFQWFSKSVYWLASGGKEQVLFYEPMSKKTPVKTAGEPAPDRVWKFMVKNYPSARTVEVHYPDSDTASISGVANFGEGTYWNTDVRYFDQHTFEEITVNHSFGRKKDLKIADKIMRMNYDIHVGAILGLPGKIMAFCASLICASLPVTGFMIWWGRRKKDKTPGKKSVVGRGAEHLRKPPQRKPYLATR
ncbi:MAG: PepSY domain-containing protein [Mucilaginibacter polytrichastri]|nr:PepSY domain-containing protein [Mucilaginibacter polytrichastri]